MELNSTSVQNLTLAAALIAAISGPAASIWVAQKSARRAEKTRLILSIHWKWFGPDEMITDAPFIHIENRSAHSVFVNEVRYYWGVILRSKRHSYTALWMEDPSDIDFPYKIEAGGSISLMLDGDDPISIYRKLEATWAWLFRLLRRFPIRVVVETTERSRQSVSALEAISWQSRPTWSKANE